MVEALIIDACRTPRGIGKAGKGALSDIHPQHLGAAVLSALRERSGIDTAEVDDIIWGTSAQVGQQTGDIGRMSALDAGYDVRASGVTLSLLRLGHHQRQHGGGLDHGRCRGSRNRRRHRKDVDGDASRRRSVDDRLGQSAASCKTSSVSPGCLRRCNRDT